MKGWVVYSVLITILAVGALGFGIGFVVSGAMDEGNDAQGARAPLVTKPQHRV